MKSASDPPFDICERAFEFAVRIVALCRELHDERGVSRILAGQLVRSGTSVGANLEEGQAAQSRADFIHKYSIARKELRETTYWLRLLKASRLVGHDACEALEDEATQLLRILTTIIRKSQAKND